MGSRAQSVNLNAHVTAIVRKEKSRFPVKNDATFEWLCKDSK